MNSVSLGFYYAVLLCNQVPVRLSESSTEPLVVSAFRIFQPT